MDPKQNPSATLHEIRSLMERSTRFVSLSGLSGIVAGIIALLGVGLVYLFLDFSPFEMDRIYYLEGMEKHKWGMDFYTFLMVDAICVMVLAALTCTYFTSQKARRQRQTFDPLTRRLLINVLVPLAVGGIFCLALFYHNHLGLLAPSTLIFYGLALLNASKFTFEDIRYLGYSELALGLLSLFLLKYGLEFWAIGFGFLHIFYGVVMYRKYDH